MNTFRFRLCAIALIALPPLLSGGEATLQTDSFVSADGYDQANFGGADVTIHTRNGAKTLHIAFAKLRVSQTAKPARIHLPGTGIALLQHAAGRVKFVAAREKFEPLEGEWMRLALPAEFQLGTDEDTILQDLILVQESGAKQQPHSP